MNADETSKGHIGRKLTWSETLMLGAEVHCILQESLAIYPSREQWQREFLRRQYHLKPIERSVIDELWQVSDAAGREFNRLGGKKNLSNVVVEILGLRLSSSSDAQQVFEDFNNHFWDSQIGPLPADDDSNILNQESEGKRAPAHRIFKASLKSRIVTLAGVLFVVSCLIPPWRYTADRNGEYGFHSHKPAGYRLIFYPPKPQDDSGHFGVEIDFGRLFLEWATLVAITGIVWVVVIKPIWLRSYDANRPQFTPPTGNPEN